MRYRLLIITLLSATLFGLLLAASPRSSAQTAGGDGRPDQAVLTPGPTATPGPGLAATNGMYLSPPTEAAHAFTHMLVRREAGVPEGARLTLFARASADGEAWGEWIELTENDDMWTEADGPDVVWSQTLEAGGL